MAIDFTGTAPITGGGQVFVKNANGEWELANVTAPGVVVQTFTADGTYTPSPGMIFCIVEAVGAGGGGGSAFSTATGDNLCAAGGGAGEYARSLLTSADIGASKAVQIGDAGAGSTVDATNGTAGQDTTLGTTLVVASGGSGGGYTNTASGATNAQGGAGGTGGTGDVLSDGGDGFNGQSDLTSVSNNPAAGNGGASYFGSGGIGGGPGAGAVNGEAGTAKGSGGGGGFSRNSTNDANGGNGAPGYMIITEYIRQSVLSPMVYDANGNELLDLTQSATSAVNYPQVINSATGVGTGIDAAGSDTNVDLLLNGKGTGVVKLDGYQGATALLSTGTVSGAAVADFDVSGYTEFNSFRLVLHKWYSAHTTEDTLRLRFSTNAGSTFDAGATNYESWYMYLSEDVVTYTDIEASGLTSTYGQLEFYVNHNTSSSNICGGWIDFFGLNQAFRPTYVALAQGTDYADSNSYSSQAGGAWIGGTTANAFRLLTGSTANLTLHYSLYGNR